MKEAMVSELKARLSAYLAAVRQGETVVVRDRRTPIAKLVPFREEVGWSLLRLKPASKPGSELVGMEAVQLRRKVDLVQWLTEDRRKR